MGLGKGEGRVEGEKTGGWKGREGVEGQGENKGEWERDEGKEKASGARGGRGKGKWGRVKGRWVEG